MKKNLFAKLDGTKSVEVSDEIVRGIPRSLSEAELALVAGGAMVGGTTPKITFPPETITVTQTCSGIGADDCGDGD